MLSFLQLIRYKNLLILLYVHVLIKYVLLPAYEIDGSLSVVAHGIFLIALLSIAASGYLINAVYDIEIDKINRPERSRPGDRLSMEFVKKSYVVITTTGAVLGIGLALHLQRPQLSFIPIITLLGLYYYSKSLRNIPLIGNFIISLFIGFCIYFPIIFENIQPTDLNSGAVYITLVLFAFFAFILNLCRELIKDIEDIKGDYAAQLKTYPIVAGRSRAFKLTALLLFFLLSIVIPGTVYLLNNLPYTGLYLLIFIVCPMVYLMYQFWYSKNEKKVYLYSILLKFIMFTGSSSLLLIALKI